jgi:hypothetical protein
MAKVDAVFSHGQFIWMLQTDVPVVLLDPGFNGTADLPNVDLTTFAGYAVHAWSLESQVILHSLKESGIFIGGRAHRLVVVPGQHMADAIEDCAAKGQEGD